MKKPQSARIFAVVNQKGGVGKTTTAVNLSAELAQSGKHVLIIDADPQANATSGVGIEKGAVEHSLYDVLVDELDIRRAILGGAASIPNLDILPSSLDLSGAEMVLYSERSLKREFVLRKALKPVLSMYDVIIIDGPPSLGLLTVNILAATERLLIPIQCEYYALEGISQLLTVIERIRGDINRELEIGLVILTMQDSRTNLSQQVIEEVREFFGDKVARTIIPRNVRLSEAPSFGRPISLYDGKSKGAMAYHELAEEILQQI
jgi:chromosome partitioning protein